MKKHSITLSMGLLIGGVGISTSLLAGPAVSTLDPKDVVVEDAGKAVVFEKSSPWFVTGGAVVRSIGADFRQDGHKASTLNWRRYVKRKSGRGDVGLYKGSGTLRYDDGTVGPRYGTVPGNPEDGTAFGRINGAGQFYDTGRASVWNAGPRTAADFHSSGYKYGASSDSSSVSSSDTDTGVGPYVQVGYRIHDAGNLIVNMVTGWSFVSTDQSSGAREVSRLGVIETKTSYTYSYDTLFDPSISFPFVDPADPTGLGGFIYDTSIWNAGGRDNALNPRKRQNSSRRTVAQFYAVSQANLDVKLNEIPFGVEFGRQIGPVEVFLTGGATLNIISYDLTNNLTWYQAGRSGAVARSAYRDSGTPVKVGLYGGITARLPLSDDGRFYAEARGSYRWVDSVSASAGIASVDIDVSSWEGGFGFGIIF